jgi:hypothetical protein
VGQVAVPGPGRAAGGDRRSGAHPAGAHGQRDRGEHRQREHGKRNGEVHPERHGEPTDTVDLGLLAE